MKKKLKSLAFNVSLQFAFFKQDNLCKKLLNINIRIRITCTYRPINTINNYLYN